MRIILDTNVLISGIFFPGKPSLILKAWKNGLLKIVLSAEIFFEYQEVIKRIGVKFPLIETASIIDLIAVESELIKAPKLRKPICDDPDDDKFFACAISGKVKIIVSGDHHLLNRTGSLNIKVLTPAQFVASVLT